MGKDLDRSWSRRRRIVLAAATILISLAASLAISEVVLRALRSHIESSDRMQPGLILYDRRLGWRMAPNWRGWHRHYDYEVTYTTNRYGYRGAFHEPGEGRRVAVLGDSFTFGLGVEDHETFVQLLNAGDGNGVYLNFAVPGYSTDQELLLLRDHVVLFQPDTVLLVVYLGNDLFDNQRAFPIQAAHGKPFFRLASGELVLENTPVPLRRKPAEEMRGDLASMVLPGADGGVSPLVEWLGSLELARRSGLFQTRPPLADSHFRERFAPALELFSALINAVKEQTKSNGATLKLALLAGRSYVESPDGYSARYQDYLRRAIARLGAAAGVAVIDLALPLRKVHADSGSGLLHPYEGHLTPKGHRKVAELLQLRLESN